MFNVGGAMSVDSLKIRMVLTLKQNKVVRKITNTIELYWDMITRVPLQ